LLATRSEPSARGGDDAERGAAPDEGRPPGPGHCVHRQQHRQPGLRKGPVMTHCPALRASRFRNLAVRHRRHQPDRSRVPRSRESGCYGGRSKRYARQALRLHGVGNGSRTHAVRPSISWQASQHAPRNSRIKSRWFVVTPETCLSRASACPPMIAMADVPARRPGQSRCWPGRRLAGRRPGRVLSAVSGCRGEC
jgi:hypothetical protein